MAMRTKEEYYQLVLQNRELAQNPDIIKCICPNTLCEWHGQCKQCVALHRYHADHIPVCLQPIINEKLKQLVGVGEMAAVKKEGTPVEYRLYVRDRDKEANR